MFELIKKIFIGLLTSIVNVSNHTKCLSLGNQKCKIQPSHINLHPNNYIQEFHYYPFAVKLDRCVGSCSSLNDLSNKACVPNKTEDLNLCVLYMITGINESKILTRHISCQCSKTLTKPISCQCKYRFDERKCNSDQWCNNDSC